jgi:hypothetical protein
MVLEMDLGLGVDEWGLAVRGQLIQRWREAWRFFDLCTLSLLILIR